MVSVPFSFTECTLANTMTLEKVKGNFGNMFNKNLTDIVRGIRGNKSNEYKYIAQCLEEIKNELNHGNEMTKANAVSKLTYLQMLGYEMSWAAFNVIEIMSGTKFSHKRVGYLAASQSFHADTELLMLTTNTIRKDLNSTNQYEVGIALSALSCFINAGLARDLASDVLTLLNSTKPYVRKKAVLVLHNIILKFPEMLTLAFPRITEKLEDKNPCVQSAAMNVLCELAGRDPKSYLKITPLLFKLLTTTTNNWLLIKIIKLLGMVAPQEPRLGSKLIENLTNLVHTTCAMSVLYECIKTLIAILSTLPPTLPVYNATAQLCTQKLVTLIEDTDPNIKYLGLTSMSKMIQFHSKFVQNHKDLVIQCLDDRDESIYSLALDILPRLVTKKKLPEIVHKLVSHMNKVEGKKYRDQLLYKVIDLCSYKDYQHIMNFEWYIGVLVYLSHIRVSCHGPLISSQLIDITMRVSDVRKAIVEQMLQVLQDVSDFTMCEVLSSAGWICGEFCQRLPDQQSALISMCDGRISTLPGPVQAIYLHNILKLFSHIARDNHNNLKEIFQIAYPCLQKLMSGDYLEVQERACSSYHILQLVEKELSRGDFKILEELSDLYTGDLNPVSPTAQQKVTLPPGLDLDQWINEPPPPPPPPPLIRPSDRKDSVQEKRDSDLSKKQRKERLKENEKNPHYLKSPKPDKAVEIFNIPITEIELSVPLRLPETYFSLDGLANIKKKSKKKHVEKKHHVTPVNSAAKVNREPLDQAKLAKKCKKRKKEQIKHEDIPPEGALRAEYEPVLDSNAQDGDLITLSWDEELDKSFLHLAENDTVVVHFKHEGLTSDGNALIVTVLVKNKGCQTLKEPQLFLSEGYSTSGLKLAANLPAGDSVEKQLEFQVKDSGKPHKMSGVLAYETDAGYVKLDWQLPLPSP